MKLTQEQAFEKLKVIADKGLSTKEGPKPFVVTEDISGALNAVIKKRIGVHGEQFYVDHINKFTNILNRCDCQYWIYTSDLIDGHVMLVVDFFR